MGDSSYYGHGGSGGGGLEQSTTTAASFHSTAASNSDLEGRLFVGGLSWQTTEESLRWHFEPYGEVASVELMRDRNTGKPRGFGFVVFRKGASVDLVLQTAVHEINHKVVDVKRAQARGLAPPSIHQDSQQHTKPSTNANHTSSNHHHSVSSGPTAMNEEKAASIPQLVAPVEYQKVFVGGIPHEIDREALKDIFTEFATVVETIIMVYVTISLDRRMVREDCMFVCSCILQTASHLPLVLCFAWQRPNDWTIERVWLCHL
jgi:RNA-binding protein Musashi